MKVLSCKVSDELFDLIDSLSESHSDFLRKAIEMRLKSIDISYKNSGVPIVHQQKDNGEYEKVCNEVDELVGHYVKESKDGTKKDEDDKN